MCVCVLFYIQHFLEFVWRFFGIVVDTKTFCLLPEWLVSFAEEMHETCASLCSPAVCLLRHRIFISLTRCPMEFWLTVGTTQTSFLDQTPWQNHNRRESLEAPINWRKVGICCNDVYSFFRTNHDFRGALLTHMVWAHVALFQFDRWGSWGCCRRKQSWAKSELGLIASAVAFGGRTEQRTEAKRIRITIVLRKGSFGGHSCREDWMITYWKGGGGVRRTNGKGMQRCLLSWSPNSDWKAYSLFAFYQWSSCIKIYV